ncbi:Lipid droplet-associated hydrolase [Entamoeba marina]
MSSISFVKHIINDTPCIFAGELRNSPLAFIIVPGNPSINELYTEFASLLIHSFNAPVVITSLASSSSNKLSLGEAIHMKQTFFQTMFEQHPNTKYIVLCHSIGNYITLKALQQLSNHTQILSFYCLFPAIKNLSESLSVEYKILSRFNFIIYFVTFFLHLLAFIPLVLLKWFFRVFADVPSNYAAVLAATLTPSLLSQMLMLCRDEGYYIKDYEEQFIQHLNEFGDNLKMIYGRFDKYGNEDAARTIQELCPKAKIQVIDTLHALF